MQGNNSSRRKAEAEALRAIVDQFLSRETHPARDVEQFERLAGGLIDLLGAEHLAEIVLPLCHHAETPPSIVARLLDKGADCAKAAFEFACGVSAADVRATAEHGPAEHAAAIARRGDLDRDIVAALAARPEPHVLCALAANADAHLDSLALRLLVRAARDDLALARILLDRGAADLDAESLFLAATRDERAALTLEACRDALAAGRYEPPARADADFEARLDAATFSGDQDAIISLFTDALDCRKGRVRAIVVDPGGEPLALTLSALGVSEPAAVRVLLSADPRVSHDPVRVRALRALMRSTPPAAAARIVAAMTGATRHEQDALRRAAARDAGAPGWRKAVSRAPQARPAIKDAQER